MTNAERKAKRRHENRQAALYRSNHVALGYAFYHEPKGSDRRRQMARVKLAIRREERETANV